MKRGAHLTMCAPLHIICIVNDVMNANFVMNVMNVIFVLFVINVINVINDSSVFSYLRML